MGFKFIMIQLKEELNQFSFIYKDKTINYRNVNDIYQIDFYHLLIYY